MSEAFAAPLANLFTLVKSGQRALSSRKNSQLFMPALVSGSMACLPLLQVLFL